MVAFDNTILSLLIFPDAEQHEGADGTPVEHAHDRVQGLIQSITEQREKVLIPTPALAELLVTEAADTQDILDTLRASAFIEMGSFDERAAVELAMRLREARRAGDQREGLKINKNAMKFDRQIVAISLVRGAEVLYSDDTAVAKFAEGCGLQVKRISDIPVPATQQRLDFPEPPPVDLDEGLEAEAGTRGPAEDQGEDEI